MSTIDGSASQPLLPTLGGQTDERREEQERHQLRAVFLLGLGATLMVSAAVLTGSPTLRSSAVSATTSLFRPTYRRTVSGSDMTMFKRTHLSIDAIKEGVWLSSKLGMGQAVDQYWYNTTGGTTIDPKDEESAFYHEGLKDHGHNSMDICAARALFEWQPKNGRTSNYNWHEFQGSHTESGILGPDYWWDLIYKWNTELVDEENKWNVFLHQGSHMYVNDLSKHMAAFERDGTPHLARHYKSTAKGDEGRTIYVAFVPNSYNGQTIIIHSKSVSVDKFAARFSALESSACTYAVSLPVTTERLETWWQNVYAHKASVDELPLMIPVMDSKPTYDIDEVVEYFVDKLHIHQYGATTALHDESQNGNTCKVFELKLASQFQTEYQARFVYTPSARNFDELGRFIKYTDSTVRSMMGFNSGYSRWLDDHWGIQLSSSTTLDTFRKVLERADTPYHAHATEMMYGTTVGSIWAWGVSGMAIEWHSDFDYTSFNDPIGAFDFCSADSVCSAATYEQCYLNTSAGGAVLTGASSVAPDSPF